MITDRRLERVMTALSGRERAIVFLREYKDGKTLDPTGVAFFSDQERREYGRLIDVIRLCNGDLANIALIIKEQVAQEELRFRYLQTMRVTADDLWLVGEYLNECMKEPITKSEVKSRKRKPPTQGFDVYADEDADEVELLRKNRALIDKLTGRGCRLKLPLDMEGEIYLDPKGALETARLLAVIVRDNLASHWTQLQAVSTVIEEYREEFNGEDPLRTEIRAYLDDALKRIVAVKDQLLDYIGEWDLPDDHSRSLEITRQLVDRVLG